MTLIREMRLAGYDAADIYVLTDSRIKSADMPQAS
jgi:hypothetical protein